MGKSYSRDLRERVEGDIRSGHSRRDAARRFGVSPSFAVKLSKRVALTGSTAPARQGRPAGGGKLAAHMEVLIGWVEARPRSEERRVGKEGRSGGGAERGTKTKAMR